MSAFATHKRVQKKYKYLYVNTRAMAAAADAAEMCARILLNDDERIKRSCT
jgi:hypothetical protein